MPNEDTPMDSGEEYTPTIKQKKSFIFLIKKRFVLKKSFKPLKAPELNVNTAKDLVVSMLKTLSSRDKTANKEFQSKTLPTFKILSSKIVFFALISVVFFAVFILLALIFLVPQSAGPGIGSAIPPNPSLSAHVDEFGHASFSTDESLTNKKYSAYSRVEINSSDLDNVTAKIAFYQDYIPKDVYLVMAHSEQATSFNEFKNQLTNTLEEQGITLNEIDISQLEQLPPQANAVFIIPTGFVPASFLGLEDNFTFLDLLNSNSTIIYIGHGFDFGAITKDGRKIPVSQEVLNRFGLQFTEGNLPTSSDFYFTNPQYSVTVNTQGSQFVKPQVKNFYGSMSSARYASGYMFFIPNSLDGGWAMNGTIAALDVAKLVRTSGWQEEIASQTFDIHINSNKTSQISALLYTPPYDQLSGSLKLLFTGQHGSQSIEKTLLFFIPMTVNGRLNHAYLALPTSITGRTLTINGLLNENNQKSEKIHIITTNSSGDVVSDKLASQLPIPTTGPFSYEYVVDMPSGDYLLKATNDNGYVYAQSFLYVPLLNISLSTANWDTGTFTFDVSQINPLANTNEKVSVKNIHVLLDGKDSQTLGTNDTTFTMAYSLNKAIPDGKHTFTFDIGVQQITIEQTFVRAVAWYQNPLYQLGLLIVAVLFIGASLIKRPETVIYKIDVPDFPPLSTIRVPVNPESVISIFDQVNRNFKWSCMPLTVQELKTGFSKLHHEGRPLLIGDFNLERIMDKLINQQKVGKFFDLYGLKAWEKTTNHSLRYLAIFRKMRNIFVAQAIQFSDLDTSPEASSVINNNIFIHIYEDENIIPRVLSTLERGKTILVFDSQNSLEEFIDNMYSSSHAMQILKMQQSRGNLLLTSIENFEKALVI